MKEHHHKILKICLWIIVIGVAFLVYDKFLDGTVFNKVTVYNLPEVKNQLDTKYFTPMPIGDVMGIYLVQTDKTSYAPGDEVFAYVSFCKYRNLTPVVRWQFINDIVGDLGYRMGQVVEPGCYKNIKVFIGKVPDELSSAFPNAQYSLHGTIIHQVNPFRKISFLLISNFFTIKK
jgi:hypothetical protein